MRCVASVTLRPRICMEVVRARVYRHCIRFVSVPIVLVPMSMSVPCPSRVRLSCPPRIRDSRLPASRTATSVARVPSRRRVAFFVSRQATRTCSENKVGHIPRCHGRERPRERPRTAPRRSLGTELRRPYEPWGWRDALASRSGGMELSKLLISQK